MEGKGEKVSRKNSLPPGKNLLPPGWEVRVSRRYPFRPYFYNTITKDSLWERPVLSPKEKSRNCSLSPRSNSGSPSKKVSNHVSKNPGSPSEEKTIMKKRKAEPSASSPPSKISKAGRISFKINSARSVKPPSQSIGHSNNNVKLHEQKRPTHTTEDSANVKKKMICGTKTAVVDPIVRKSSTSLSNTNEKPQKGSVFSRLDARKLLRNISVLDSSKKKKNRRKSKSEVPPYSLDDDIPKSSSKQVASKQIENKLSFRGNQRKSPTTCVPKTLQHSSLSGEQKSSSSKVQQIPPLYNKAPVHKSLVNVETNEDTEEACEIEDVEMTDISQNMPNLDDSIEPMKIDDYLGNEETLMLTHFVLDTNFLVSHLKFIDELKDKPFDGCGLPVIFIPWIVIQELDKIKQKRSESALCGRASEAVRYLYDMFHSRHPRFRGQSCKMAARDEPCYQSDCNDDKVLQCCEQLFEKLPREKVMLLTEDKNLINKAFINDIFAYTKESLQKYVAKCPSAKAPATAALVEKEPDTDSAMKVFLDGIACEVKCQLKSLLAKVVTYEFEKVYGELWTKIIIVSPPWTLVDLLHCIKKHWIAVFSYIFSDEVKMHCERLQEMLKKTKGYISEKYDVMNMFASAEVICREVMKRRKSVAESVLSEINKLKLVCELQFQKNSSNQTDKSLCSKASSSVASSEGAAFAVFQYLWNVIDHFTSLILNCCDVQPGISSAKPQQLLSDIVAFLPRFYRCVGELHRCMRQVLEDVSNDFHVKELHTCLVNFVPSLKTDVSPPPDTENFTAENLAVLFRDGEKKELLENGFVQLRNFFQSLDRCIARNGLLILRGTNGVS